MYLRGLSLILINKCKLYSSDILLCSEWPINDTNYIVICKTEDEKVFRAEDERGDKAQKQLKLMILYRNCTTLLYLAATQKHRFLLLIKLIRPNDKMNTS